MLEARRSVQVRTGIPVSRVPFASDRDDHRAAAILAYAPVTVADGRIEIDGIAFLEDVPIGTYDQFQLAADQVQQLHAGMLVGTDFFRRHQLKFRVEGVQLSLTGFEVQAFEVISDYARSRIFREI